MGMTQLLNLLHGPFFDTKLGAHSQPNLLCHKSDLFVGLYSGSSKYHGFRLSVGGSWGIGKDHNEKFLSPEEHDSELLPHIQTLREFPQEELVEKVVLVRFDSTTLLQEEIDLNIQTVSNSFSTIKYLWKRGSKVILVGNWREKDNSNQHSEEFVADLLSTVLQLKVLPSKHISCSVFSTVEGFKKADVLLFENLAKFKEETANCLKFAELLSSGVDIFVNDCFSQSHRILASNVGIARFCSTSLAGFQFEESLCQLSKAAKTKRRPYVAIIGGGNLRDKVSALQFLASTCDGLIFVGMMSFQIMHALGLPVPVNLVEIGSIKGAFEVVQFALERNIKVLYPEDCWCTNDHLHKRMEVFPIHKIPEGWTPADLGPTSLEKINSVLMTCKKIIWIGPLRLKDPGHYMDGASKLAKMLDQLSRHDCDITLVGNMACEAILQESNSVTFFNMFKSASVIWVFLSKRKLPGVFALDRAYPYEIDWKAVYCDPSLPLVVDIGSGNGLSLLEMARRRKDCNFLGLEINEKLVKRCQDSITKLGTKNAYFIATNATSTFRSVVSSYPGELVLVSIQCPNPDFRNPEHRWRMIQRSLVEAIVDLLAPHGKVFLQSDIEAVAVRMKESFLKHGKGKVLIEEEKGEWLNENPFGVRSDWEQHVIDRGDPMFRLMLSKSSIHRKELVIKRAEESIKKRRETSSDLLDVESPFS